MEKAGPAPPTDAYATFKSLVCTYKPGYLYLMVAQNTVRTNGVNQIFRFIEGIRLHQSSRQIRFFSENAYFTSYVQTPRVEVLYFIYYSLRYL